MTPGLLPPPAHRPVCPSRHSQAYPGTSLLLLAPRSTLPHFLGLPLGVAGDGPESRRSGLRCEKPPPHWGGPSGPVVRVSLPGHLKKGEVRGGSPEPGLTTQQIPSRHLFCDDSGGLRPRLGRGGGLPQPASPPAECLSVCPALCASRDGLVGGGGSRDETLCDVHPLASQAMTRLLED